MFRKFVIPLILAALVLAACAEEPAAPAATELPPEPAAEESALQPAPVAEEQLTAEASEAADSADAAAPEAQNEATAVPQPAAVPDAADLISTEMLATMSYSSEFTADGSAALQDGEYREQAAPGSATETVIYLTDHVAYGELNGQPVAAVVLVSDPGGSGTFYSLHIVGLQERAPVELAYTALGDRVQIGALNISDNQVTIEMVVAGPQDPLCCPTQQVVQVYELHGDELVKTADEAVGSVSEAPAYGIVNRLWSWQKRDGAAVEGDPQQYTLIFLEDGAYQYTADCTGGGGLYATNSHGAVSFQPDGEPASDCGPDSEAAAMIEGLQGAHTYRRENGDLFLTWGDPDVVDTYSDGGPVLPDTGELAIEAAQISLDTQGLYETWTAVEVGARPVDDSSPPGPVGLPDHIEIYFDYEDPAQREGGAIMYIIPVDAYKALWELAGYDWIVKNVDAIYEFARAPQNPPPTNGVPMLPNEELAGVNDLAVQIGPTGAGAESASQTGYRFVGRSAQDANPVTNQDLRYIYQGFTNDGQYLVAFFAPIGTDELPDDAASLPQAAWDQLNADMVGYLEQEAQRLNGIPPYAWEPSLLEHDDLLNSLQIEGMLSAGLQSTTWAWTGQVNDPTGGEVTVHPLQGAYTAAYDQDLVLSFEADCNLGSSSYELTATGMIGGMNAAAPASTLVECGPDSFSQEFARMLQTAQTYRLLPGGKEMILAMPAGGGDYLMRDAADLAGSDGGGQETAAGDEETRREAGSTADLVERGITLDVAGVAETYAWEVLPQTALGAGPGGHGFPAHVLVTFDGESSADVLANNGRRLHIFPAQPYIDLYEAAGRAVVTDQVARLQELIDSAQGRLAPPAGWMPLLPPPDNLMESWAQFRDYDFVDGMGVRYVSDSPYRSSIGVWGNDTLGYYYEGLTQDGRYYISLWWPVSTEALPITPDQAPTEVQEMANNPETNARYLQETKNSLNALPPNAFAPSLAQLDVMVGSLAIGE